MLFLIVMLLKSVNALNTLSCFTNLASPCSMNNNVNGAQIYFDSYNKFVARCNKNVETLVDYQLPPLDSVNNMDCQGSIQSLNYNFNSQCRLIETYSALYSCIDNNQNKYNSLISSGLPFVNIILNMPEKKCTSFFGMGTIPRTPADKENTIWIQSSRLLPQFTNTLAHELGHTSGLQHAGTIGSDWEYSDCSCPMGCAADGTLCYNAPNANKLGWSRPIFLNGIISKGKWVHYFLPIYATTLYNNYVVNNLTFSLRSSIYEPGIKNLMLASSNGTYVPAENTISIHMLRADNHTIFIDALEVGGTIWDGAQWGAKVLVKHFVFMMTLKGSIVAFYFY